MREYFPKSSGRSVKDELDLSNYATNEDLKNTTGADTSNFAKKIDLPNLKSDRDILDADKLLLVHVGLSKLSDLGKDNVVKKDV